MQHYSRINHSEEAFQLNVNRLKEYKNKLVIFPRNAASKKHKAGDSSAAKIASVTSQNTVVGVLPVKQVKVAQVARAITKDEKKATVTAILRKQLTDGKLWGQRIKKAADKAAADKAKGKKK
jgi:large subunit ribosomal protein L13e